MHPVIVGVLTLACAAFYAGYSLIQYWHYRQFGGDLGIFDQAARSYAHFQPPHAPLLRATSPSDPGALQIQDHFTPILVLLAPLYWIHDGAANLLVAQGVLFALALPPLWLLARRQLGVAAAYLVVLAYAVAWPLQESADFDFHESAFAVPLMMWMFERANAGRWRQSLIPAALLLLVKEDMDLVVAAFGVVMVVRGRRRLGAAVIAGSLAVLAVINVVVMSVPGSQGTSYSHAWTWGHLGNSPSSALVHVITHPVSTLVLFGTPAHTKLATLGWLALMGLGAFLLSPLTLLALPLIAERFLSDNAFYWGEIFHYNTYLVPIVFAAGIEGAARLGRFRWNRWRWTGLAWATGVAIVGLAVLPKFPMWQLTKPAFIRTSHDPRSAAINQALKHVPDGAVVGVDFWGLIPHLTQRAKPVVLPHVTFVPPWMVVGDGQRVSELRQQGYRVVYDSHGWAVLHLP